MTRPCRGDHPDPADHAACRLCWLVENDPKYRAYFREDDPAPPPAPRPKPPPCAHRGDELTGAERDALGLSHARRWAFCLYDERPLGDVVCGCKGCGPKCPGYSQAPAGRG